MARDGLTGGRKMGENKREEKEKEKCITNNKSPTSHKKVWGS